MDFHQYLWKVGKAAFSVVRITRVKNIQFDYDFVSNLFIYLYINNEIQHQINLRNFKLNFSEKTLISCFKSNKYAIFWIGRKSLWINGNWLLIWWYFYTKLSNNVRQSDFQLSYSKAHAQTHALSFTKTQKCALMALALLFGTKSLRNEFVRIWIVFWISK